MCENTVLCSYSEFFYPLKYSYVYAGLLFVGTDILIKEGKFSKTNQCPLTEIVLETSLLRHVCFLCP